MSDAAYKVFTIRKGIAKDGAIVKRFNPWGGLDYPAILVGKTGRLCELGALPVVLLPEQLKEWRKKGSTKITAAKVTETRLGEKALVSAEQADSDEYAICVLLTHIGRKGGNTHTGGPKPYGEEFLPFPGEVLARGRITQKGARMSGYQLIALIPKMVLFRTAYQGTVREVPGAHYYMFNGKSIISAETNHVSLVEELTNIAAECLED
jgi:hypothetical protein